MLVVVERAKELLKSEFVRAWRIKCIQHLQIPAGTYCISEYMYPVSVHGTLLFTNPRKPISFCRLEVDYPYLVLCIYADVIESLPTLRSRFHGRPSFRSSIISTHE